MESRYIKRFAIVILSMVAGILCWLVFWPANLLLAHQLIILFNASNTFSMFLLCNAIIVAVFLTTYLGSPWNSIVSPESFCGRRMLNSEIEDSTEQMKFICSDEDAGANAIYGRSELENVGCLEIIKYRENCQVENCPHVSLPELMQLVEVRAVIDSKYNNLASMIDRDFNRTVEEFISEFKCQLRLQR